MVYILKGKVFANPLWVIRRYTLGTYHSYHTQPIYAIIMWYFAQSIDFGYCTVQLGKKSATGLERLRNEKVLIF